MKLSKRLSAIADLVTKGADVVDVGSDHGLVPVFLAKNELANHIIASDSSAASLEAARFNAAKYGVADKVKFVVTSGLCGINADEIDTVIIAGLGGETIVSILDEAACLKGTEGRHIELILQPQTKREELFLWLRENGYRISQRLEAVDRSRSYLIMKAAKPLSILITAGGTSEKIDDVRMITNKATGKLASMVADEFSTKAAVDITFVCGENSILPSEISVELIKIGSVTDLTDTLKNLLTANKYDAVIHTMAVSDYRVSGFMTADDLSSAIISESEKIDLSETSKLTETLNTIFKENAVSTAGRKISSDIDGLILVMEKGPKAISIIKQMQPETILVGFKLLTGASEDELLRIGYGLMQKNNCDFVLANDSNHVSHDRHEGILISPDQTYERLSSKKEIAAAIVRAVLERRRHME
jgi:phosphopantothenate-cysteine ligase